MVIDTHGLDYGSYGVVIEFNHNADDGVTYIPVNLDVGLYDSPGQAGVPLDWSLDQNHPNPFNPTTTISYSLKHAATVKLAVYDVTGREVVVPVEGFQDAGSHRAIFDGSGMAAGVYFYRIEAAGYTAVRKMVLVK
ncbi:MAG TPA: T9SS type A sorting domain-containing protein [Bacteroidetes bacterium]|nr:T9SS type A sorting domain-containing protein [Bacteroidota bacterium]